MSEEIPQTLIGRVPEAVARIMTAEAASAARHGIDTMTLERGDQMLAFFGAEHTNDPTDPMFDDIESLFEASAPALVVVEGLQDSEDPEPVSGNEKLGVIATLSKREMIMRHGERSLAAWLARERGLPIASPEPKDVEIAQQILKEGYTPEDLLGLYTARTIVQIMDNGGAMNDSIAQGIIDRKKSQLGLEVEYDVAKFRLRPVELLGINIAEIEFFQNCHIDIGSLLDPLPGREKPSTVFNKISEAVNKIRDSHMVGKLAGYVETHKRVFTVYGYSHLLMQRPALKYLFQD